MNTIEPIMFEWEGDGIETDDNYERRFPDWAWNITSDFVFHRAATNLCDEISPNILEQKYSELVDAETETIREVLPISENKIVMGQVSTRGRRSIYYVRGESVIVPSTRDEGLAQIVSKNKNAARDLRGKLVTQLEDLSEQFHGAGIDKMNIITGQEFTLKNISHSNAEIDIQQEEPDDFETQILEELTPLSEAFVSNIRVDFLDYPANSEYDLLFASGPYGLLQIEVKDYSGTDNQPGVEEAIHKPLRKASLMGINQTISVIKGVDSERMGELKMHSELRNQIKVVEKNELVETVKPILERILGQGPGFYPLESRD